MAKKHVQVRLDLDTYKKLQHYVIDQDTSIQDLLEQEIKKIVSRKTEKQRDEDIDK